MTAPPMKADHFHICLPMPSTITYSIPRYLILAEPVGGGFRSGEACAMEAETPSSAVAGSIPSSFLRSGHWKQNFRRSRNLPDARRLTQQLQNRPKPGDAKKAARCH